MPKIQNTDLIFLKLGGSLITEKATPRCARLDLIARLVTEIKQTKSRIRDLSLVLGHGSGSFGHFPAQKYGTRRGVGSLDGWQGFAEVWYEAATLNWILMDNLHTAGLPGIGAAAA